MKLCISLILIGLTIAAAVSAPYVGLPDPNQMNLSQQFQSPSLQNFFGLDQNGSSVISKVFWGARVSLEVSFSVVMVSVFLGLILGTLAGYFGKWFEKIIMRFVDLLQAFPGFLLAIALVSAMGASIQNVILAMCVTGWTGYARLVRAEVLHLREKDFVVSALALGAKTPRIIFYHIWPNLFSVLVVQASFGLAGVIVAESALSFLGLGAPPTTPTWGSLLNSGRSYLIEAPHISLIPGVCILCLVLGFNLLGDVLSQKLNPRLKK